MADGAHHDHHHYHHDEVHQHPLHGHKDNDAFTEVNRAHWNEFASRYSSEQWQRDMLNDVTAFIHQYVNWIGVDFIDPSTAFEKPAATSEADKSIRVLDYACGPGTITHALGPRAAEYVGIDLSENMVKAYNLRFNPDQLTTNASPPTDGIHDHSDETLNAHALVGNLLDANQPSPENLSSPEFFNFDLVVVGMGFHHFQDIALATSRLVERVRPGGVFLILDFVTHAMDENASVKASAAAGEDADEKTLMEKSRHTVAHAGFSEEELKAYFENAGLVDFGIVRMDKDVRLRGDSTRRPFLARGKKA